MASAEQVVVEIIADDSRYDPALRRAARSTRDAANDIERSVGRVGQATRNLGFQFSDIGTQISGGTSPFIIISQQAPQVVQALEDIKAAGGTLGQTLQAVALPAFIAVASIAATFAEKMFKGADAANAKKQAVDALTEAMQRLAGAEATANHETAQGIKDDIARTETLRQQEHQTRATLLANLQKAKSDLEAALVTAKYNPGPEIPGRGVSSLASDIAELNKQIDEQSFKIAQTDKAILAGYSKLVLRDVKGRTDAATAATQKYEDALDGLQRKFEAGKIGKVAFEEQTVAITRARDATLAAISSTKAANRRAAAELKADAKRDAAEYAKLVRETSEGNLAGELVRDNDRLRRDRDDPDGARGQKDALREIGSEQQGIQKGNLDAMGDAIHEQFLRQQDDIRNLSGLYYDLFSRGTKGLWEDFKEEGLRALARLAAEKTFAAIASLASSGGIVGSVASLLHFGRASGGYVAPGQAVRINEGASPGRVEGFIGPSTGGRVVPLGRMNAAATGGNTTIVQQSFVLDNRGGITTKGLIDHVNAVGQQALVGGAQIGTMGGASEAKRQLTRPGLPRGLG